MEAFGTIWRRFWSENGVGVGNGAFSKTIEKTMVFQWFSPFRGCFERVLGLQIATTTTELEDWRVQWQGVRSWKLFYGANMRDRTGFMVPQGLEYRLTSETTGFDLRTGSRAGASYARFL